MSRRASFAMVFNFLKSSCSKVNALSLASASTCIQSSPMHSFALRQRQQSSISKNHVTATQFSGNTTNSVSVAVLWYCSMTSGGAPLNLSSSINSFSSSNDDPSSQKRAAAFSFFRYPKSLASIPTKTLCAHTGTLIADLAYQH